MSDKGCSNCYYSIEKRRLRGEGVNECPRNLNEDCLGTTQGLIEYNNWKDADKCTGCNYVDVFGGDNPCFTCLGSNNWFHIPLSIGPTKDTAHNNGGATDYYDLPEGINECQGIIEWRNMNFAQGNIFKATFCFNTKRHEGTNYERELNKIIYYCEREKERIKKENG